MDAESELDRIEAGSYSADEALATLVLVVNTINAELASGGGEERIRRLVERLRAAAEWVADKSDARGFSISGGFPDGVSVSVNWVL